MSDTIIKVPALGESVTEAIIARLYKKVGESVNEGDVVVELETDKVTLEVNAPAAGVIQQISVSEGDTVKIGDVIGSLLEGASAGNVISGKNKETSPNKGNDAKSRSPSSQETSGADKGGVGPAARKLMTEQGISLSDISGTGKNGRITKEDVVAGGTSKATTSPQVENSPQSVQSSTAASIQPIQKIHSADALFDRKPMSPLRKKIGERLKYAQNTAAILTTFNECDMSTIMELRRDYQDAFVKKYGTKLGFMSFFVKACVHALQEVPAVNAEIDGDDMVYHHRYDIGIAVSAPQGLVVPVLKNAEHLGLHEIELAIAAFGEKAKTGKLTMADMTGGTFTISNGGTFGSLVSTPILNPPQSGILGMHKIQERPVALKGQVIIRPMMYLALSYDHRMIDGREAVTFLVKVKEYIENPTRLLLGI